MSNVNVTYQVYSNGKWLPNVTNLSDYAGIYGQAIEAIQVEITSVDSGNTGGSETYPPVTGSRKVFIDPVTGGS